MQQVMQTGCRRKVKIRQTDSLHSKERLLRTCTCSLYRERHAMNCAYCRNCVLLVNRVLLGRSSPFSQEGAPQTHQPVLKISKITGIHQLSVGCITYDLFRTTHSYENNMLIRIFWHCSNISNVKWQIIHAFRS